MLDPALPVPSPRRPLVGIAVAYLLATWAALAAPPPFPPLWGAAVLCLAAALWLAGRAARPAGGAAAGRAASVLFYAAVLLAAGCGASLRAANHSPHRLDRLMARPAEGLELEGRVADDPAWRGGRDGLPGAWEFTLRVEAVRRLPAWQAARGSVRVALSERAGLPAPRYGDRWRLAGALRDRARDPDREDPGAAWRAAVAGDRLRFRADAAAAWRLDSGLGWPPLEWCYRGRRAAAAWLARGIEHRPDVVGLLRALLLGMRTELDAPLRRAFRVTGTAHVFAISGQHVAIVAMFLLVVLQTQRVCRTRWVLFAAPLLAAFIAATGMSASAVRGCLMALLVLLAPLLGRRPDPPSALAAAALLILAADPAQALEAGWGLSFAVVAGLMIFCPPMLRAVDRWLASDPWRLQPECRWARMARATARAVALLVSASLAAWLVSAPLVARWFNLVSPIALLANLLVVPLVTLLILNGGLALAAGAAWPALGAVFNFASVAIVSVLEGVVRGLARIPGGYAYVAAPPVWAMLAWYAALGLWRLGRRRAGALLLLGLALAWAGSAWRARARRDVEVLAAGAAPALLVRTPGHRVLLQAGSRVEGPRIVRALQRRGINRLSAMILPAGDAAHAGGAPDILEAFRVGALWLPAGAARFSALRRAADDARHRGFRSAPLPTRPPARNRRPGAGTRRPRPCTLTPGARA